MKVIGIGDNVVDEYVHKSTFYPGGNAFNFSVYSKMLGFESAYLGIFGTDDAGKHVKQVANELEIDISRSLTEEGENGHAYVTLKDGDRVFLSSNRGGIAKEKPLAFDDNDLEYISNFQLIHSSIHSNIIDELPKLKATNVPIAFDFSIALKDEFMKRICPYIDYAIISCGKIEDCDIEPTVKKFHAYGTKYVLATMGSKGAMFSDSKKFYNCKPKLVEPVDTMGAGDSFLTAFLTNFIQKQGSKNGEDYEEIVEESLRIASEFSAKTCLVEGSFGYGKATNKTDGGTQWK